MMALKTHDCANILKVVAGKIQLSCKQCACDFYIAMKREESCLHVLCLVGEDLKKQIAQAKLINSEIWETIKR